MEPNALLVGLKVLEQESGFIVTRLYICTSQDMNYLMWRLEVCALRTDHVDNLDPLFAGTRCFARLASFSVIQILPTKSEQSCVIRIPPGKHALDGTEHLYQGFISIYPPRMIWIMKWGHNLFDKWKHDILRESWTSAVMILRYCDCYVIIVMIWCWCDDPHVMMWCWCGYSVMILPIQYWCTRVDTFRVMTFLSL